MKTKAITKNALRLFEYALEQNLAGTQGDLCKKIGLVQSNLADIRKERRAFTHEQLHKLIRLTGGNMNWVYGFSEDMFLTDRAVPPTEKIRQALTEIEALLEAGKKVLPRHAVRHTSEKSKGK